DAARMRELVPGIEVDERAIGAWEPGGGFVDPNRTLESFAKLARASGAVTRLGVELLELRIAKGRVTGARTSEGEDEAEQVVIGAGPWTRDLFAKIGVRFPLKVVRPENHYLGVAEMRLEEEAQATTAREALNSAAWTPRAARGVHAVLIDLEHGFYARCDP